MEINHEKMKNKEHLKSLKFTQVLILQMEQLLKIQKMKMQEICTKISKNDLKKGDAILKPDQHVVLFGGWIDSDKFHEFFQVYVVIDK